MGAWTCRQPRAGEVRSSPPGDHRADASAELGGGAERGGGTCRGAKVPEGKIAKARLRLRPAGDRGEALGEQVDVEDLGSVARLSVAEKIEEQRGESSLVQQGGHFAVAGAEPAGAAPVREDHQARGVLGQTQVAVQNEPRLGLDLDGPLQGRWIVGGDRIGRRGERRFVRSREQIDHLLVVELSEVDVELADAEEAVGLLEADHLVELGREPDLASGGSDRDREDHPGGTAGSQHAAGRDRSPAGGDPVVDEDDGAPLDRKGLALAAVGERPSVELLGFASDDRVELRITHSDQLHVLAADDADAPLRDRSDAVLGLERRPELADKQDVKRGFQGPGDLVADRDAASRERQYQRILDPGIDRGPRRACGRRLADPRTVPIDQP